MNQRCRLGIKNQVFEEGKSEKQVRKYFKQKDMKSLQNIIIVQYQMNFFQGKRYSRSTKLIWQGSDNSNQEQEFYKQNDSNNNYDWLSDLYAARDKMLEFIEQLGSHKQSQLREDVITHCQTNIKNQKNYDLFISSDMIAKIVNIRIQKMIKNKRIKKNWSQEDVKILIWLISKYSDINHYTDVQRDICNQDWEFLATLIPGVTAESCMFKWLSLKKVNLATNNWSQQQSILLGNIVRQQSKQSRKNIQVKDWKAVSQKLYKMNNSDDKIFRNAKQCRQHWNCYLNPNLKKGPWKAQQDIKLLKRIQQNKGSKKWSQIVKDFDGRTQNALKNRYTLIIDKQKKHNKGKSQLQLIQDYLQKCYVQQFTTIIKAQSSDSIQQKSAYSFDDMNSRRMDQQYKSYEPKKQQVSIKIEEFDRKENDDMNKSDTIVPVTPVKIQKFKFQNFSSLPKDSFLKFIQPGVINPDGSFSKIKNQLLLRRVQSMT